MADRQLTQLARPFNPKLVHSNPSGGGQYVSHSAVTEKLLAVLGGYSYEIRDIIRSDIPAVAPNPAANSKRGKAGTPALNQAIVGCTATLTVDVEGTSYTITEVGDCEDPHNWPHDGARLKDASSDALKRCAMRLGVALHLWSQGEFFLHDYLVKQDTPNNGAEK